MSTRTLVFDDPAEPAAELIGAAVSAGGNIALAGGNTPREAYQRVASMDLDWSRCVVWFGDERCVGPDDQRSNFGMVRTALLDRVDGSVEVRRIQGELGPDLAAEAYERDLDAAFADRSARFDLILLGLGPDGHCASLFPGKAELSERDRLVVGVAQPGLEPWVARVTLTLPAINAATDVAFLVRGEEKAAAVARAVGGAADPTTPASLVAPKRGSLTYLLDSAAASRLD